MIEVPPLPRHDIDARRDSRLHVAAMSRPDDLMKVVGAPLGLQDVLASSAGESLARGIQEAINDVRMTRR